MVAAAITVVAVAILTGATGCDSNPVEGVDAQSTATATKAAPPIEPAMSTAAPDLAATPIPEVISRIKAYYMSVLGDYVREQGSHCRLDDDFRATVRHWASNSIAYLREYHDLRDLDDDDVRMAIVFLETQRGRCYRLCNIETGLALPKLQSVTDIKRLYDSRLLDRDRYSTCEIAASVESLIGNLSSNSIDYLRGAFDVNGLSASDVMDLISHYEGRRAYYDRLCAAGR